MFVYRRHADRPAGDCGACGRANNPRTGAGIAMLAKTTEKNGDWLGAHLVMNSMEIAELTGKRHGNVMRDARHMFAELPNVIGGVLNLSTPIPTLKMAKLARDRKTGRNAAQEKTRDRATTGGRYETKYTKQGVRASNAGKRAQAQSMRAQWTTFRDIAAHLGVSYKTAWNWCE